MAQDQSLGRFGRWLRDHYLGFQACLAAFWGLTVVFYAVEVALNPGNRGKIFALVLAAVVFAVTSTAVVLEFRRRRKVAPTSTESPSPPQPPGQ